MMKVEKWQKPVVAEETRYRRKPVYEWAWPYWLATVAVMGLLGAVCLAAFVNATGGPKFTSLIGHALAIIPFPVACILLWWWYCALQEEETETRTVPLSGPGSEAAAERDPILVRTYGRPQLEAPSVSNPEILVFVVKELWERGKLSRRAVVGLRLPGGQKVTRGMWEQLVGGYKDEQGREKPGLLAAAGLVVRAPDGSWTWREGLTLGDVMACFDWGAKQIEAPATCADRWLAENRERLDIGPKTRQDMEALWGEG